MKVLLSGRRGELERARALLEAGDHCVDAAGTPEAVLEALARGPTPDLVIAAAGEMVEARALIDAVRGHVRGEETPVLALVPPAEVEAALESGADLALPLSSEAEVLRAAIASERRRGAKRVTREAAEPDHEIYFLRNPHPMWFFDVDTLAFVAVNEAAVRKYGYSREEFLSMTIKDIRPPEDVARLLEVTSHVERGLTATEGWRHRAKDGRIFDVEIISFPVRYAGRACELILAHDVSEQVEARARLEELRAKLAIADRMAAIGTLAAGVAHEINNPLTWILTNVAYVMERLDDPGAPDVAELQEALGEAVEGTRRVRTIVKDLKTFAKADEESVGPVELSRVASAALNLASNEVSHRARVVVDVAGAPPVQGNEARIIQVLLNLVVNAAHALPDGRASENEIRVTARPSGDRVEIVVSDTGAGVDPAIAGRIFDPFFTTKPVGQGTGLGLWICRRILESLGGAIELAPASGRGASFRVTLPVSTRPATTPPAKRAPIPAGRRPRVLIVDDEALVGRALARGLKADADVEVETWARAALSRVERGERFDLVLSDVMMPDLAGAEFHDALAKLDPAMARAVVFMTGGAFSERAQAFLSSVPNARLEKPIDMDRLRELVFASVG